MAVLLGREILTTSKPLPPMALTLFMIPGDIDDSRRPATPK
jgi:hypothetical protein